MYPINPSSSDYSAFWQMLTAYRQSALFTVFDRFKLADCIHNLPENGRTAENICKHTGWEPSVGKRMLDCFCKMGMLTEAYPFYHLSDFSAHFFLSTSPHNQCRGLSFEKLLEQSWGTLGDVLLSGKRVFNSADKPIEDYQQLQYNYIGAMDDAAHIRSQELWADLRVGEEGTIADFGAGSGAYLAGFLSVFTSWKAIFCDLEDVVAIARKKPELKEFTGRIHYYGCNLLDPAVHLDSTLFSKIDIMLFSNFIHCYNEHTLRTILNIITPICHATTTIIIHDFFNDLNWQSSLYDIHMMLNTYDGKVYSTSETIAILKEYGFTHFKLHELPSKSAAIIAQK
jgi:hypothetical protein